jgi:Cohesin domain
MFTRYKLPYVVLVSALAMCIPSSLFADAVAGISPGSANVVVGQTFDIPVSVSQVSDLFSFQFDLSYDPIILELQSISEGSFLPTAGSTFFLPGTIDNTAGTATFTADSLVGAISGASGDGALAIFSFEALTAGTSALTLSNVVLIDSLQNEIPFGTTDGQVIVSSAVPEPRLLPVLGAMLASVLLVAGKFRKRIG